METPPKRWINRVQSWIQVRTRPKGGREFEQEEADTQDWPARWVARLNDRDPQLMSYLDPYSTTLAIEDGPDRLIVDVTKFFEAITELLERVDMANVPVGLTDIVDQDTWFFLINSGLAEAICRHLAEVTAGIVRARYRRSGGIEAVRKGFRARVWGGCAPGDQHLRVFSVPGPGACGSGRVQQRARGLHRDGALRACTACFRCRPGSRQLLSRRSH